MLAFLFFLVGWLCFGYAGHRLVIWWWTHEFDFTREEQRKFKWLILAGPANLFAGVLCALEAYNDYHRGPRPDDQNIIYPRKDLT
jgi:hypothetical protein